MLHQYLFPPTSHFFCCVVVKLLFLYSYVMFLLLCCNCATTILHFLYCIIMEPLYFALISLMIEPLLLFLLLVVFPLTPMIPFPLLSSPIHLLLRTPLLWFYNNVIIFCYYYDTIDFLYFVSNYSFKSTHCNFKGVLKIFLFDFDLSLLFFLFHENRIIVQLFIIFTFS